MLEEILPDLSSAEIGRTPAPFARDETRVAERAAEIASSTHQRRHGGLVPLEVRQDHEPVIGIIVFKQHSLGLLLPSQDVVHPTNVRQRCATQRIVPTATQAKENEMGCDVGLDLVGGGPVAGLGRDSPTHHSTRLGGKLWMYGTTTRSYISAVSETIALSCAVYFLMCVSVAGQITLMMRSGKERDASQAWDEKYCGKGSVEVPFQRRGTCSRRETRGEEEYMRPHSPACSRDTRLDARHHVE